MREVRVVYRKFDGSLHWHLTMRYLGEDEFGVWTGMPAGGFMQRGTESPVELAYGHVGLFPHTGWWTAWFNGRPRHVEVYCDIATPPVWTTPDEVTMVDLDLDVVRDRETGKVRLLDEDEFAEHQVRYRYPPDVIERAGTAATWLTKALGDGTEPFNSVYKEWFAKI